MINPFCDPLATGWARMKITSFARDRAVALTFPFWKAIGGWQLRNARSWETTYRLSNLLDSARIEFDVPVRAYLLICPIWEAALVAWEETKRDQFSWKTACVMPAYRDQPRLLSKVQSGVRSGNEKYNVDRIDVVRVPLKILITGCLSRKRDNRHNEM